MRYRIAEALYNKMSQQNGFPYTVNELDIFCYYEAKRYGQKTKYYEIELSNYFVIEKQIYDEHGNYTVCGYVKVAGKMKPFEVPADIFSVGKINRASNHGFNVFPGGEVFLSQYAQEQIFVAPKFEKTKKLGWHPEPDGKSFGFCGYNTEGIIGRLKSKGDLETTIKKLNKLLTNAPGCQLAVATGLASSIIGMLATFYKEPIFTPIVNFYGNSSTGKTTALNLACSMWTSIDKTNDLFNTWLTTDNALINLLSDNNGVCVIFDDNSSIKGEKSQLLYNISQGVEKLRMTKDLSIKERSTWNTLIISSGETSLRSFTNKNEGLTPRIIEFFDLEITLSAKHSEDINMFCSRHYGVIGKEFNGCLIQKNLPKDFKKTQDELIEKLSCPDNKVLQRRNKYLAIIILAAKYAKEMGLTMDIDALIEIIKEQQADIVNEATIFEKAYNYINGIVATGRYSDTYFTSYCEDNGQSKRVAYWTVSEFKNILSMGGFTNIDSVVKEFKKHDKLHTSDKSRRTIRITRDTIRATYYGVILDTDNSQTSNNGVSRSNRIINKKIYSINETKNTDSTVITNKTVESVKIQNII